MGPPDRQQYDACYEQAGESCDQGRGDRNTGDDEPGRWGLVDSKAQGFTARSTWREG